MQKSHLIILGIIGILGLGFYLQWPILTQGWPIFIFLLCPLMHIFMGHNHGDRHEGHTDASEDRKKDGGSCH